MAKLVGDNKGGYGWGQARVQWWGRSRARVDKGRHGCKGESVSTAQHSPATTVRARIMVTATAMAPSTARGTARVMGMARARVMVCCCCCCCSAIATPLLACCSPNLPVLLLCVCSSSGRMGVGGMRVVEQWCSRVVVVGYGCVHNPPHKNVVSGTFLCQCQHAFWSKISDNSTSRHMSPTCCQQVADIPSKVAPTIVIVIQCDLSHHCYPSWLCRCPLCHGCDHPLQLCTQPVHCHLLNVHVHSPPLLMSCICSLQVVSVPALSVSPREMWRCQSSWGRAYLIQSPVGMWALSKNCKSQRNRKWHDNSK